MSLSLGRNETAAELHQNLTDGEVVRIEKVRLDGRRTKYWMGRSETELSSGSCHKQKKKTPQNEKMRWHCVLNTPPHPQDTFYIAINSAILAAGNKKERRKSPPPSHVLSMCSLPG